MLEFEKLSKEHIRIFGLLIEEFIVAQLRKAQRADPPKKKDAAYYEELRQKYGHKKIS